MKIPIMVQLLLGMAAGAILGKLTFGETGAIVGFFIGALLTTLGMVCVSNKHAKAKKKVIMKKTDTIQGTVA